MGSTSAVHWRIQRLKSVRHGSCCCCWMMSWYQPVSLQQRSASKKTATHSLTQAPSNDRQEGQASCSKEQTSGLFSKQRRRQSWTHWRPFAVGPPWSRKPNGASTTSLFGYGSIPIDTFLVGWTSIYQLFWCSPGVQGFDTLPFGDTLKSNIHGRGCSHWETSLARITTGNGSAWFHPWRSI